MKKIENVTRYLIRFILSAACMLTVITLPTKVVAAEDVTSGTCGENLTWTFDASNSVLTIRGEGEMKNYPTRSEIPWYALKSNIQSVVIESGVTSIGTNAFYFCLSLKSVQIPDGVQSISEYAFSTCTSLKRIEIPASVTYISGTAFSDCNLQFSVAADNKNYTSKDGVLYDKEMSILLVANGVSGDFVIPSGVRIINVYAFDGSKLTSVQIPSSVESIGDAAFSSCKSLNNVTFEGGSKLQKIDESAFSGCSNLKSIVIPPSVTEMEGSVLSYCSNLTDIVILSKSITTTNKIINDSNSLTTVIYPENCSNILDTLGLSDIETQMQIVDKEDGTVSLFVVCTSANITNGTETLTLPSDIGGKTISAIGFAKEIPTDQITISHTEHYLNKLTPTDDSSHLIACTLCDKRENSESHNFGDGDDACVCGYVPFTVTSDSTERTFIYGSTAGKAISVSADTTFDTESVAYQWYMKDTKISNATDDTYSLPANMKAGSYDFSCKLSSNGYSSTLTVSITVSKKPVTVQADNKEKTAGKDNPVLTFSVPAGALVTGDTTADWKVNLTTTATKNSAAGTYVITGTITSDNYKITLIPGTLTINNPQVTAPKKWDKIRDTKNKAVYKVTQVGNTKGKIGTVQYVKPVKKSAKTVSIPATITVKGIKYKVTSIASNAFKNNRYVTKVTIGNYVKTIGSDAFFKCKKLTNVTIGTNVTTIKSRAFYGCDKLKTITVKTKNLTSKKIGKNAFKGIKSSATINVPKKKYKAYKSLFLNHGVTKKAKFKKI